MTVEQFTQASRFVVPREESTDITNEIDLVGFVCYRDSHDVRARFLFIGHNNITIFNIIENLTYNQTYYYYYKNHLYCSVPDRIMRFSK